MPDADKTIDSLLLSDRHWQYIRKDTGMVVIWGPDDDVSFADLALAAREIRARMESDLVSPAVRLVPPPQAIVGDIEPVDLMRTLDAALIAALSMLGVDRRETIEACSYGMGSEYRGWLAFAREHAIKAMGTAQEPDGARWALAEEVVLATSAVAVAMRHGYSTLDFTIATVLRSLRHRIPKNAAKRRRRAQSPLDGTEAE